MIVDGIHVSPFSNSEKLLVVGIRTHGRGTFFVYSNKESAQRKCRPNNLPHITKAGFPRYRTLPTRRLDARPARETYLAFPGQITLPKHGNEASSRGTQG